MTTDQTTRAPASRPLEVLGAACALVVSTVLFVLAGNIELRVETGGIDPRWWPRFLGLAGIVISAALLLTSLLRRPREREEVEAATRSGRVRFGLTLALVVLFLVLWPVVGFVAATLGLLVAVTAVFGGRGIRALVVFPVLLTTSVYLVFDTLLKVPL